MTSVASKFMARTLTKVAKSLGVMLLIETLAGSYSIQPTASPCKNLFAYYLFKELKIEVPMMRIIGYQEKEYRALVWKVESATFQDPQLQARVLGILNKPYWMVRQYFPAISIDKLNPDNAKE